jgi:hypothetical protein
MGRNVDAEFGKNLGGNIGGVQAVHGAQAGGDDLDIVAAAQHVTQESLRHRAAANIACAYEQNLFHRILIVC